MATGATLNLPAPVHGDKDDPSTALPSYAAKAARVDDVDELTEQSAASRYASGGIIYPPPELRNVVDKTAQYVARNGIEFESKIRSDSAGSTRLSFLNEDDAYNAYYRAKLEALTTGKGSLANVDTSSATGASNAAANGDAGDENDAEANGEQENKPNEPEPFRFSADMPAITALDLDIVKLTALFVAKRGRAFASKLIAREGKSYQFEFLRPTHSLFGFFNRLVEQYRLVMEPSEEMLKHVRLGAFGRDDENVHPSSTTLLGFGKGGGRLHVLDDIRERAEWERYEKTRRKLAEDEETKERAAFDEIDWQDFVVVGTIELTEQDEHMDLPPPMSLREVRTMSMAQKRMAAMIMEGEEEDDRSDEAAQPTSLRGQTAKSVSEGERERSTGVKEEEESNAAASATATPNTRAPPPMKIRKDYQPKTLAERKASAAAQTTICPVCGQSVPLNEMDEHVRIELSNPQFREQRRELEMKRAQHNALMEGADPSKSLKQFASRRTDIFGSAAEEETQRKREQDEARKRKERETIVWDGHAASGKDTKNEFNRPETLQSEMMQIQKRFKTDHAKTYAGPQFAEAAQQAEVEAEAASTALAQHNKPVEMQGATMQQEPLATTAAPAAPQHPFHPPSAPRGGAVPPQHHMQHPYNGTPPPLPPMHGFQQYSHQHQHQYQPQHQHQPQHHSQYQHQHQHSPGAMPDAHQQPFTLERRTDGALYPEQHWLQYHPNAVRIYVQLPDALSTSDKLDGGRVSFDKVTMQTTIGALRDRVQSETLNGSVGASRLKLRVNGKATTLRQTLAYWNILDGDVLTLQMG